MKTIILTMRVTYDLNGEDIGNLKFLLSNGLERAVGNGLLSGDTAAEVEDWRYTITDKPE